MRLWRETYEVDVVHDEAEGTIMELWRRAGKFHRDGAPALVTRHIESGIIIEEEWYRDGVEGRADGPAEIRRNPQTGIVREELWLQSFDGKINRLDGGPAHVLRDTRTGKVTKARWFRNGRVVKVSRDVRAAFFRAQEPRP
jgi:hypothetical protein